MEVKDYFTNYKTYPIIFAGTGLSLRYLEKSYTWDDLLNQCIKDMGLDEIEYLKIKANFLQNEGAPDFPGIGAEIEKKFND